MHGLLSLAVTVGTVGMLALVILQMNASRTARPHFWAVCALVLFVAAGVLPQIGSRHFTLLGSVTDVSPGIYRLASLASLAGTVCAVVSLILPGGARPSRATGWGIVAFYALMAAITVGGLTIDNSRFDRHPLMLALVVHALCKGRIDCPQALDRAARLTARLLVGGSLVAMLVSPQWAFLPDSARGLGIDRLAGLFPHPNALSMFAGAALVTEFLPGERSRFGRLFVLMPVAAIILTQSSTGLLFIAVAAAVWLGVGVGSTRVAWVVGVGGALLAAQLWGNFFSIDRFVSGDRLSTVSGRTEIWDVAVREYQAHPWFGEGTYFLSDDFRITRLPSNMQQASHAHNQFFQTLGESGRAGVLALTLLTCAVFVCALRAKGPYRLARVAGMTFLIVYGLTENPLRPVLGSELPVMLVLPIVLAGCLAVERRSVGASRHGAFVGGKSDRVR